MKIRKSLILIMVLIIVVSFIFTLPAYAADYDFEEVNDHDQYNNIRDELKLKGYTFVYLGDMIEFDYDISGFKVSIMNIKNNSDGSLFFDWKSSKPIYKIITWTRYVDEGNIDFKSYVYTYPENNQVVAGKNIKVPIPIEATGDGLSGRCIVFCYEKESAQSPIPTTDMTTLTPTTDTTNPEDTPVATLATEKPFDPEDSKMPDTGESSPFIYIIPGIVIFLIGFIVLVINRKIKINV